MQKEEKKSNKEFLKKRQFNRMTGIQIEELIQREKVDEMEVKRGKIIKHIERLHLEDPISDQQHSKAEIQKIVLIKLCSK